MKIGIIDYGAGNIANVKNAFEKIGTEPVLIKPEDASDIDALVLPGVGAFGRAMKQLESSKEELCSSIKQKPFLGICLGMQLLLNNSEESPGIGGLNILKGEVKRFKEVNIVPQMGWNRVYNLNGPLFDGIKEFDAYFVHSYYCDPAEKKNIAALADYGITYACALWKKNIFATQFHPEKSGKQGLQILRNFIKEVKR